MFNILAVDDEEDILYTIKYGFEKFDDFKINTAKDGEECLNILKHNTPDLILLDIMMPKMNGWQVLDIILGNPKWRNIPVFFITGAGNSEFKKHAEELGITYIEKPFTIEDLKKEIDAYFMNK